MSYLPEGWDHGPASAAARPRRRPFAAALELVKAGRIELRQSETFAPIELRRTERAGWPTRPTTRRAKTPIPGESLFEAPPMAEQERMVEAMLFASAEP
jgi:hypothetical protein